MLSLASDKNSRARFVCTHARTHTPIRNSGIWACRRRLVWLADDRTNLWAIVHVLSKVSDGVTSAVQVCAERPRVHLVRVDVHASAFVGWFADVVEVTTAEHLATTRAAPVRRKNRVFTCVSE